MGSEKLIFFSSRGQKIGEEEWQLCASHSHKKANERAVEKCQKCLMRFPRILLMTIILDARCDAIFLTQFLPLQFSISAPAAVAQVQQQCDNHGVSTLSSLAFKLRTCYLHSGCYDPFCG